MLSAYELHERGSSRGDLLKHPCSTHCFRDWEPEFRELISSIETTLLLRSWNSDPDSSSGPLWAAASSLAHRLPGDALAVWFTSDASGCTEVPPMSLVIALGVTLQGSTAKLCLEAPKLTTQTK